MTTNQTIHTQKMKGKNQLLGKVFISLVILSAVSLQAYTALLRMSCKLISLPLVCSLPEDPGLYPFLNYPMYSDARKEGVAVKPKKLIAVIEGGEKQEITAEGLKISQYHFIRDLMNAAVNGDYRVVEGYVQAYESLHQKKVSKILVEEQPIFITKEGVNPGSSEIIRSINMSSAKE